MNRKRFILLGVPVCRGTLAQPASCRCATLPPLIRGEVAQPRAMHRGHVTPEGIVDDERAALPATPQRQLAGTSGLLEDAPSARRLPALRHRGGNDEARTDAVAWFALFEMLPVLRERARAFERIGVRRRAREGQRIWDLTVRPRARA